jgi:hypothetical protein
MRAAMAALALALAGCSAAPIDLATLGNSALTYGLIAHWALDEASGAAITDSSGNGHNGVLEGSGWSWMSGRFGADVHFSGADTLAVSGLPNPTHSYTVSAGVLISSAELGAPLGNLLSTEALGGGWALYATLAAGPGGSLGYVFRYAANVPQQYWAVSCNYCLVTDSWTHVAAVLDGDAATLTLYVGSASPVTISVSGTMLPGSSTLNIGRSAQLQPPFPVMGALDDIAIYSRALAAEEVAALGAAPAPDPH